MFQKHPSQKLNRLYIEKKYQGSNPDDAHFLFIGKDPNWFENIEHTPLFEHVEAYLNDGPSFISQYNVHHPFMLGEKQGISHYIRDGKKYHRNFLKLRLPVKTLLNVSFVDLVGFPTTGMSGRNQSLFQKFVFSECNMANLVKLDYLLNKPDKTIFIAWGLLNYFKKINQHTCLFNTICKFDKNNKSRYDIHKFDNYYIHPHFSDAIRNDVIDRIALEINRIQICALQKQLANSSF